MQTDPPRRPWYFNLRVVASVFFALTLLYIIWRIVAVFIIFSLFSWLGLFPQLSFAQHLSIALSEMLPPASAQIGTAPPLAGPTPEAAPLEEARIARITASPEMAYHAWSGSMILRDVPVALALYRPDGGGDPEAEVEGYIAELRAVLLREPEAREGPLGRLLDIDTLGEYADPAEPGVRYWVTRATFDRGEVCYRGALVEHGDGWYVRGWGRLTDAECADASARVAEGQR